MNFWMKARLFCLPVFFKKDKTSIAQSENLYAQNLSYFQLEIIWTDSCLQCQFFSPLTTYFNESTRILSANELNSYSPRMSTKYKTWWGNLLQKKMYLEIGKGTKDAPMLIIFHSLNNHFCFFLFAVFFRNSVPIAPHRSAETSNISPGFSHPKSKASVSNSCPKSFDMPRLAL